MSTIGPTRPARPRRIAAIHRQADAWRIVVAEIAGRAPHIVDAATVPFGDADAVRAMLRRWRIDRILRIAPASATVCRAVELPAGSETEVADALTLLAEAQLPSTLPPHRRGAGIIAQPEGDRWQALLVGWSGAPGEAPIGVDEESWTTDAVALAGLTQGAPATMAVYADRDAQSMAIVTRNGISARARSLRTGPIEQGAWPEFIRRTMAETGADEAPTVAPDAPRTLWLDDASRRQRREIGVRDDAWLADYGIAAGAALGCLRAGPEAVHLYDLLPDEPREDSSPVERIVAWLRTPRHAAIVVAAALLLALLAPLAFAWARSAVLSAKLSAIESSEETRQSLETLDQRLAFNREVESRRWPMTKLLAEISRALPIGAEVETLQLDAGQRFLIRGRAESFQQVRDFQAALAGSRVFGSPQIGQSGTSMTDGRQYQTFEMTGAVTEPFRAADGLEQDYAEQSLAVRLYGDRAHLSGVRPEEDEAEGGSAGGRSGSRGALFDRRSSGGPAPDPIPEPLTDEAIAQMDNDTARGEFAARRKASSRQDLDAATEQRLKDEVGKLRDRLRALRGGG